MKNYHTHSPAGKLKWIGWLAMLAALTGVFSCEEVINVSFSGDSTRNLVVEGSITTDTMPHKVLLSYTGDYFDKKDKEMAPGAEVSITDGTHIYPLMELTDGEYYTDKNVYGEVGKTYTLNIRLQDGRQYSASDYLSNCTSFDSIRQSVNYNTYLHGYGYDVVFYGREPEPAGDYYMYLLYINNILYSDTITEVTIASDEFVNGNYIRDYAVYRIREADIKSNASNVTLVMYSISKQYYEFMRTLKIETIWRGSPWDGPPANIPGNVSNGGTGFFRASDVKRRSSYFLPFPRIN